jgi:diaminohydroxyphosphoribosylaminopyrimidine deaminase/5-amino-6-(5-phosphoribosylamino)uracil reductase
MDYMSRAVSLAKLALGQVSPNPAVGAVIVKNRKVIGQGYTQPPGGLHAEIVALKEAGAAARGATLYTTLEPCCHYGRTPPCTKAIVDSGIKEVHAAMIDPNPKVNGEGRAELEKAGISVEVGEHQDEACEIVQAYSKYITTKVPFVTAKFAMSLDGKIATRTGDSRWISSEESRRYVHYLRFTHDAIIVGVNTVLVDDPQLTARCSSKGGMSHKQPLRVVVDSEGKTPPSSKVFNEPGNVLMAVSDQINPARVKTFRWKGADVVQLPSKRGLVDLKALMMELGKREITSVLVEGGGQLLGSVFDNKLVDKVIVFIAPIIIGGRQAKTPVAGRGVLNVADSLKLERVRSRPCNGDQIIYGYVGGNTCLPGSPKSWVK